MDSSISITLASTSAHEMPRRLKLSAEPIVIGRASRSEQRAATAKTDNALFECPVVSREHAELIAHKDANGEDEVTLTDLKSMHGTFVNGHSLDPGIPFALQDGDLIQLGTSVARGNDTYKGVTIVFKKNDSAVVDAALSTGSTYSVPADESDIASERSDAFGEDLDDIDQYDDDDDENYDYGYVYEGSYGGDEDHDDAVEPQVVIGTQQKPIEVEDWPASSLRNVMDLTQPEILPSKLPPLLPANLTSTITQKLTALEQSMRETDQSIRDKSVELAVLTQSLTRNHAPPIIYKPRYDPVRGTPPASTPTVAAVEHRPVVSQPAPVLPSTTDNSVSLLYSAGPPPSVHIQEPIQAAKSNKRKAETSILVDEEDNTITTVGQHLSQLSCATPAKRVKMDQPSRLQTIISDARKYAFGVALGATGTFTLLASPLGGALADWASKY